MSGEEVLIIVSHYCEWPERFLLRLVSKKLLRDNNLQYWYDNGNEIYNELSHQYNNKNNKFYCVAWYHYTKNRDLYKLGLSVVDYFFDRRNTMYGYSLASIIIDMFGYRMLRYIKYYFTDLIFTEHKRIKI